MVITQLRLVRRCDVYPKIGAEIKRVMAEFAKNETAGVTHEKITIEQECRGDYTAEYRTLTKDFYLKF